MNNAEYKYIIYLINRIKRFFTVFKNSSIYLCLSIKCQNYFYSNSYFKITTKRRMVKKNEKLNATFGFKLVEYSIKSI